MLDMILKMLGIGALAWIFGSVLKDYLDAKVPPDLPRPRFDPRDKRREWDRIQGR